LERVLDVDLEARLEEFRRTLEENALAGHHIDLSAVQKNATDSLLWRLVPWDVERFTRLAVRTVGGQLAEDRRHPKVFRLSVPREFLRQRGLSNEAFARGLRVAFEREAPAPTPSSSPPAIPSSTPWRTTSSRGIGRSGRFSQTRRGAMGPSGCIGRGCRTAMAGRSWSASSPSSTISSAARRERSIRA